MAFAETAKYFDLRAKRARNPDSRARFEDAGRFYRSLARITANFPSGYAQPRVSWQKARWEAHAEECRTMAECFYDPRCREQLLRLADSYDGMAQAAE